MLKEAIEKIVSLAAPITFEVSAPAGQAIGVKEALAMYLERWGDCRVVSVEETQPEQLKMELR